MNAEDISNILNGKPSGNGFIACCPAHDDKSPSLSITDGHNGLTLIHCFAGCSADAIMTSMGLKMNDLYIKSNDTQVQHKKYKQTKNLLMLLQALNHELHVLLLIVSNRVCDQVLSKDKQFNDHRPEFSPMPLTYWEREKEASKRITKLIGDIYGN